MAAIVLPSIEPKEASSSVPRSWPAAQSLFATPDARACATRSVIIANWARCIMSPSLSPSSCAPLATLPYASRIFKAGVVHAAAPSRTYEDVAGSRRGDRDCKSFSCSDA